MNDLFGRKITYMRLSVTELCNLRCRYCMPAEGIEKRPHEQMLTEEEMISAVRVAASLGVSKLRITGGEPLVKRNIVSICEKAAAVPGIEELCLTTNAVLLPEFADKLKAAGVSHINISLDTLDEEKYSQITRIGKLSDVLKGIECAINVGFDVIKINAVLIGGFNDEEVPALAGLTQKYPVDVRFIELMPMLDQKIFSPDSFISCSKVLEMLPNAVPCGFDGVARTYRLPGAAGKIGLISPLSNHFCAQCSRIRLTADGKLKPCLHSSAEYSIKGLSEDAMREQFIKAILDKPKEHPPLSAEIKSEAGREMVRIGG